MFEGFAVINWRLIFVAAALLSACGTDEPLSKDANCAVDTDCPSDQHCGAQNTCVAECGAASSAECSADEICGERGRCVSAGECVEDADCDSPPMQAQCEGDTAVGLESNGTCDTSGVSAVCVYESTRNTCEFGCGEGRCLSDPCVGVTCTELPEPSCDGANTRVTYSSAGVCQEDGQCAFEETREVCAAGCVAGECLAGFCDAVTCDSPPDSRCNENTAQTFAAAGTCDDSTGSPVCTYELDFQNCDYIKGTCEEAACVNGISESGELVVTEYLANPAGGFEEAYEWFEVINTTGAAIDLNGWQIVSAGASSDEIHVIAGAPELAAGARMVFGRNAGAAAGGVNYVYGEDITLANSTDWFGIQKPDGENFVWVDYVYYETGSVLDGRSRKLNPDVSADVLLNNEFENWCPSLDSEFGTTVNFGTPGAQNTACDADPCAEFECVKPEDFCADKTKAVQFAVDSAMCEVTRFNNPFCNFEATEVICQNEEICGSGECREIPANLPDAGEVIFTEIMSNPGAVSDNDGEWFELHNLSDRELSLFSLVFRSQYTILDYDAVVPAGGYIVFVANTDPAENGGIEGGFYFGGGRLQNSAGATQPDLVRQDGVVVDSAFMGSGTSGVSRQLSSDKFDPILNDDGANWCTPEVSAVYGPGGTGDRGTPGAANRVCP